MGPDAFGDEKYYSSFSKNKASSSKTNEHRITVVGETSSNNCSVASASKTRDPSRNKVTTSGSANAALESVTIKTMAKL